MYILKFNHNSNISSERLNPKNPEIIFDDLFDLFKIYSAPIQQDIFNNLECPLSESKNVTNYYITCKECNGNGKLDLLIDECDSSPQAGKVPAPLRRRCSCPP